MILDETERVEAHMWASAVEVGSWVRIAWGNPRWEHGMVAEIHTRGNEVWANVEVRAGSSSAYHIMQKVGVGVFPPLLEKEDHPRWKTVP